MAITTRRRGPRPTAPSERDLAIYEMATRTDLTYREIADHFGISTQRAHQIAMTVLVKLYPGGTHPEGI